MDPHKAAKMILQRIWNSMWIESRSSSDKRCARYTVPVNSKISIEIEVDDASENEPIPEYKLGRFFSARTSNGGSVMFNTWSNYAFLIKELLSTVPEFSKLEPEPSFIQQVRYQIQSLFKTLFSDMLSEWIQTGPDVSDEFQQKRTGDNTISVIRKDQDQHGVNFYLLLITSKYGDDHTTFIDDSCLSPYKTANPVMYIRMVTVYQDSLLMFGIDNERIYRSNVRVVPDKWLAPIIIDRVRKLIDIKRSRSVIIMIEGKSHKFDLYDDGNNDYSLCILEYGPQRYTLNLVKHKISTLLNNIEFETDYLDKAAGITPIMYLTKNDIETRRSPNEHMIKMSRHPELYRNIENAIWPLLSAELQHNQSRID